MKTDNILYPHIIIALSSAGSGKTETLARRYIQTLLFNTDTYPQSILAITFTNKAAQEMRERILTKIKKLILLDSETIEDFIALSDTEKITIPLIDNYKSYLKEKIFDNLLENFYDFHVSTIDSFVNKIIKALSKNLHIPPDYEIITDTSNYIDEGINILFEKLYYELKQPSQQGKIKELIDEFIDAYISINASPLEIKWTPRKLFSSFFKFFWDKETNLGRLSSKKNSVDHFKYFDDFKSNFLNFYDTLLNSYDKQSLNKKNLPVIERIYDKLLHIQENNKEHTLASIVKEELGKIYGKILAPGKYLIKKKAIPRINAPLKKLENLWFKIMDLTRKLTYSYALNYALPFKSVYLTFRDEIMTEEFLKNRNLLFIEELNLRIREMKSSYDISSLATEIYIYLADRFKHYLIDEFQDTNRMQWENLKIIVDEAISSNGSLFIVGDKKQSIYRFRGGDYSIIDEIETEYNNRVTIYKILLDTNYRSAKKIIEFNNIIFEQANIKNFVSLMLKKNKKGIDEYTEKLINKYIEVYKFSKQTPYKEFDEGYIEIKTFSVSKEERDEIIKEEIKRIMKDLSERNIIGNYSIGFLTREREEATKITEWLLEMGYSVDSESTLDIRYSTFINEIISLLKFFNNPEDDLAFAEFITGKIFNFFTEFSFEKLFNLRKHKDAPLYIVFRENYPEVWEKYIKEIFSHRAGFTSVSELILDICRKFKLFEIPEFSKYTSYLIKLIEVAEFSSSENSLQGFLDYWQKAPPAAEEFKVMQSHEGHKSINVITIHKAKGLEFDVVIIPFAYFKKELGGWGTIKSLYYFKSSNNEWDVAYINENIAQASPYLYQVKLKETIQRTIDELNTIYVAFTRAKFELYILIQKDSRNHLPELLSPVILQEEEIYTYGTKLASQIKSFQKKEITGYSMPLPEKPEWHKILEKSILVKPASARRNIFEKEKKGEIIHKILSMLTVFKEQNEIFNFIEKIISVYKNHHLFDEIKKELIEFFSWEKALKYFLTNEYEVFNEFTVVNKKGEQRRIDRLMKNKRKAIIVEYKTGEEILDEHKKQVYEYKEIIKEIYPEIEVEGVILYVDRKEEILV